MTDTHAAELDLLARDRLSPDSRAKIQEIIENFVVHGFKSVENKFAALPRLAGRDPLPGSLEKVLDGLIHLGFLRRCDLAAAWLLRSTINTASDELLHLYFQGDFEERRMILRSLPFLAPGGDSRIRLLQEAHRTNDQGIFEAAMLDTDHPARVMGDDDYRRLMLKVAFLGLPLDRVIGWQKRVDDVLISMLSDLKIEREAAGRSVWTDHDQVLRFHFNRT